MMNGKTGNQPFTILENYTAPETPLLQLTAEGLVWNKIEGAKYKVIKNGALLATTSDTLYVLSADNGFSEYQILSVDASDVESFLSNPVEVISPEAQILLEAESFNLPLVSIESGFSGMGYVVFTRSNNAQLKFKVVVPQDGTYGLTFRYANGSGPINTENKCAVRSLFLNGQFASSLVFPQRGSDEWSNWGYNNPERMDLKLGVNEFEIKFESFNENMNLEVNDFYLDQIIFRKFK
jgi:hypothetical protein